MGNFLFSFACDLKEDTPQQVIDTLSYMTRTEDYKFNNPPDTHFFEDDDWRTFLLRDDKGFHFPGEVGRAFRSVYRYSRSFNDGGADVYLYTLSFRFEDKDDGIAQCPFFLDWIAPHSATNGFVGYWHWEDTHMLVLIYFLNGQVHYADAPHPFVRRLNQ